MKLRKVLLTGLVLSTFSSVFVFAAQAAPAPNTDEIFQTAVKNNVESFVRNAYDPYYKINSIKLSTSDYSTSNNVLTAQVNVSLNKTLKAKSVDEIPYVKGLKNKINKLKSTKDADTAFAEEFVTLKTKDLNDYIETPQDQNDRFRITANIVNGKLDLNNAKLDFLNGLVDWIPATNFIPKDEAAMAQDGEKDLDIGIADIKRSKEKKHTASVQAQGIGLYDRIAARDYANTWTSETGNSYNTSKWNPAYAWHTESGGVDCANYVSQAMNYGGLPTDTTWKPESTAWINTGRNISNGLKQYMVDTKNYFYETTKSGVSAGGFISAVKYSHVMFVVANDGVTMQFSAHTSDRLKASFASFGSDYQFFYVYSLFLP
jgi:hypothetical protein